MILNRNITRQWKSLFFPWQVFSSTQKVVSAGDGGGTNVTSSMANFVQAANIGAEINSTGLSGLKINTATHATRHITALPLDLDYSNPMYFRVHWTSGSSDVADTITWKVTHGSITPNVSAITSAILRPLTTPIPEDTVPTATAYTHCITSKGTLAPADTFVVAGADGVTTSASATSHTFTSASATFSASGVIPGDIIVINGTEYVVVSSSTTTLVFGKSDASSFNPGAATAISYSIRHPGLKPQETVKLAVQYSAVAGGLSEDRFFIGLEVLYAPLVGTDLGAPMPALPSGW